MFIDIETAYDCIELLLLSDHLEDYKLGVSIESIVELAGVLTKQVIFDLNDTPYNEKVCHSLTYLLTHSSMYLLTYLLTLLIRNRLLLHLSHSVYLLVKFLLFYIN